MGLRNEELSRDEILAISRKERQERLQNRKKTAAAIIIQRFWRERIAYISKKVESYQKWIKLVQNIRSNQIITIDGYIKLLHNFLMFYPKQHQKYSILKIRYDLKRNDTIPFGNALYKVWSYMCKTLITSCVSKNKAINIRYYLEDYNTKILSQKYNDINENHIKLQILLAKYITTVCTYILNIQKFDSETIKNELLLLFLILDCKNNPKHAISQRLLFESVTYFKNDIYYKSMRHLLSIYINEMATLSSNEQKIEFTQTIKTVMKLASYPLSYVDNNKIYYSFATKILSLPFIYQHLHQLNSSNMIHMFQTYQSFNNFMIKLIQSPIIEQSHQILNNDMIYLLGNILDLCFKGGYDVAGNEHTEQLIIQFISKYSKFINISTIKYSAELNDQLKVLSERKFILKIYSRLSQYLLTNDKHEMSPQDNFSLDESITNICNVLFYLLTTPFKDQILPILCFSTETVKVLWALIKMSPCLIDIKHEIDNQVVIEKQLNQHVLNNKLNESIKANFECMLYIFAQCYNHILMVMDEEEFHKEMLFTRGDNTTIILTIKDILYYSYWYNPLHENSQNHLTIIFSEAFIEQCKDLFIKLRERQSRKQFCNAKFWIMDKVILNNRTINAMDERQYLILKHLSISIPMVLQFEDRVKMFYRYVEIDKQNYINNNQGNFLFGSGLAPGIIANINRNNVLSDAFNTLSSYNHELKDRIKISFVDQHGISEAGVDGGGLFKEFLLILLEEAFDVAKQSNFFIQASNRTIYPNPHVDHRSLDLIEFVGSMVGKAIYDGIQIEQQFSLFFLTKILGNYCDINQLLTLDKEKYKNLLYVKHYDGNFDDLALTFSIQQSVWMTNTIETFDIIPNGRNINVTKDNVTHFVYSMADFLLNRQLQAQTNAFVRGLHKVIAAEWLKLFTEDELSKLISGTNVVNVLNLRNHVVYSGGYSANHELIRWFWEIVEDFDPKNQANLLKFVTSVPRAPLQGFQALTPKFGIQRTESNNDERLPTSSTCMNLLRLPRYSTKQVLAKKLLYAIQSNQGFSLT